MEDRGQVFQSRGADPPRLTLIEAVDAEQCNPGGEGWQRPDELSAVPAHRGDEEGDEGGGGDRDHVRHRHRPPDDEVATATPARPGAALISGKLARRMR